MQESSDKLMLAVLLLRTIAGALVIYGAVQIVIGVVGPAAGARRLLSGRMACCIVSPESSCGSSHVPRLGSSCAGLSESEASRLTCA